MADRIAPKGGYLFEEKDKYRREVWSVFAKQTWPPCAKVGFMPSTEGAEITIALDLGFKEENLYAIDRSAALLASAPWRKLYPGVKIYGTDVLRSGARLRNDGVQLDCMNMDLCSNLSQPMLDTFTGFINSGCHDGRIVVALTALCGRESTAVDTLAKIILRDISNNELKKFPKRIAVAFMESCRSGYGFNTLASGEYRSNKQTMSWGIGDFMSAEYQYNAPREALKSIPCNGDDIEELIQLAHTLKELADENAYIACNRYIDALGTYFDEQIECISKSYTASEGKQYRLLMHNAPAPIQRVLSSKWGRFSPHPRDIGTIPLSDREMNLINGKYAKMFNFDISHVEKFAKHVAANKKKYGVKS